MNYELIFIIYTGILTFQFLIKSVLEYININSLSINNDLPKEISTIYNEKDYCDAIGYEKAKAYLSMVQNTFSFIIIMFFLFFNGFAFVDNLISSFTTFKLFQTILFFLVFLVITSIIALPFNFYEDFVIEEKYGFNKQTYRLFFLDRIKSFFLSALLGTIVITPIVWIFYEYNELFWTLATIIIIVFSLIINFFYTELILPMFNKLTPLPDGELKSAIYDYARKINFPLSNILLIDSSRRTSKTNAFFTGFGKKKKIILFDNLLEKHTTSEIVAIIAHEMGHYKKRHIISIFLLSTVKILLIMYFFSLLTKYEVFQYALGVNKTSFHIGFIAFLIIYEPIAMIIDLISNAIYRKFEYQADKFAAETYSASELETALIKLSSNNLSNLFPHPLYVKFYYTHPPLLKRIKKLSSYE